jgi:hypothetical protein
LADVVQRDRIRSGAVLENEFTGSHGDLVTAGGQPILERNTDSGERCTGTTYHSKLRAGIDANNAAFVELG